MLLILLRLIVLIKENNIEHVHILHSDIQSAEYDIIAEHDMGDSCSVDGFIVARRKNIVGPTYISIRKYF
jgi:hypothetical protein